MRLLLSIISLFLFTMLVSCSENHDYIFEKKPFETGVNFIVSNAEVEKINTFARELKVKGKNLIIFNIDGSCPLCSLELLEIENLRETQFNKLNIVPLAVLYGELNNYTQNIINEKNIYKFPIYRVSYPKYIQFINLHDINYNVWIISKDNDLVYGGNPFYNTNDLKTFFETLKQLN
jgi:hypothetical protein